MKIVTREQMQEIDQTTTLEYGLSSVILMENAGMQAFLAIEEYLQQVKGAKIAVLCGGGNNGGDGFVVARHLFNHGAMVTVYLLTPEKRVGGDALLNLNAARQFGVPIHAITTSDELNAIIPQLQHSKMIIDAMLGTGLTGQVQGLYLSAIRIINGINVPVIAIDIPSGLDANTGMLLGEAVQASMTVTFGLPKVGLVILPGIEYVGELIVANIGFPPQLIDNEQLKINLLTHEELFPIIPKHTVSAHKGLCGKVFVLAGSMGMIGAATLCSESALRVGAGLVTLGIPETLNHIMEVKLTEVMTLPLPQTPDTSLSQQGYEKIMSFCESMAVVAMGPGIGRNTDTSELIKKLITHLRIPMVIDADAIFALASSPDVLKHKKAPAVITPHPGEMAHLLGITIDEVQNNRIVVAQNFAKEYDTTVVLKGSRTIIAASDGQIWINPTGNQGMATAGCGDVLTGMIGGLMAQGLSSTDASRLGVFLHGLAGDIKAREKGYLSLIASDVSSGISEAIKEMMPVESGK